jgi:hypothetical protein
MSTLFGRRTQVLIEGKILENPPLTIHFDIPFGDDSKENIGHITIYNLSHATLNLIKKDSSLVLNSGYKESFGGISTFVVKEANTIINGVDRETEITVGEEDGKWTGKLINKTWRANILASQILKDIIASLGLTLGELKLPVDLQYPRGKTFSKAAKLCLAELVNDCRAKMTYTRGTIYIRPPDGGTITGFILNKDTGLIGMPERCIDDKGNITYKVVCLMNYQIEAGSLIKVESTVINGEFRVKKGAYKSDDSDHIIEMELVQK